MSRVRALAGILLALLIPGLALAQTPAPLTCEQRVAILDQLVEQITQSRRQAEIELAAVRVKLQALGDQLETAKKQQAASPKPTPEPTP